MLTISNLETDTWKQQPEESLREAFTLARMYDHQAVCLDFKDERIQIESDSPEKIVKRELDLTGGLFVQKIAGSPTIVFTDGFEAKILKIFDSIHNISAERNGSLNVKDLIARPGVELINIIESSPRMVFGIVEAANGEVIFLSPNGVSIFDIERFLFQLGFLRRAR